MSDQADDMFKLLELMWEHKEQKQIDRFTEELKRIEAERLAQLERESGCNDY